MTVKEYYLRQSGVIEGSYPDVWSSTIGGARAKANSALDPRNPATAKLSLTNAVLIAEKEGLSNSNTIRTGTAVSLSNTLAYNAADGTPTLRADVERSWTDVTTDENGNELSKPTTLNDTFDYSFGTCGHAGVVSVVVDVDVSDMDMILDGSGSNGCAGASAVAKSIAAAATATCSGSKRGDIVSDYQVRCDFGQDICAILTYGKQTVLPGMVLEAGGALRWSGVHNYALGGPTSVRVEELQGWVHVTTTPAFRKANKNLMANLKIKFSTTAKFSMTVGSVAIDSGGVGGGFGKTSDSAFYALDGEPKSTKEQIPGPGMSGHSP